MHLSIARTTLVSATLLLTSLLLAACQSGQENSNLPPCPQVNILSDASRLTVYRDGPGRDLTDVLVDAQMEAVGGSCLYTRKMDGVTVDVVLRMRALRGPASTGTGADLTYFVAVTNKDREIVAREEFPIRIEFPANASQVAASDELEQVIPLRGGARAEDYAIFIGFKLTPEQVERNRARGSTGN